MHGNLGIVLQSRGDLVGAEREYREAIKLDPVFANDHRNLGVILQGKGDLVGAEREYREAIKLDPGESILHVNLARFSRTRGTFREPRGCIARQ